MASKSKKVRATTVTGMLDFDEMKVYELTKDEEYVHDLAEALKEYDGTNVTISIKVEKRLAE